MNFRPLGNRVVIKRVESKKKDSVILTLDNPFDPVQTGIVESVGPGLKDEEGKYFLPNVKKGDSVLYDNSVNHPTIKLNKEIFLIMHEDSILGINE